MLHQCEYRSNVAALAAGEVGGLAQLLSFGGQRVVPTLARLAAHIGLSAQHLQHLNHLLLDGRLLTEPGGLDDLIADCAQGVDVLPGIA